MLAGCTVPAHMRVRTSDDPKHVDRDVRFRTTYYFRVFDQCAPLKPAKLTNAPSDDPVFSPATTGEPVVLNDWLYRFRMTGKAHSLTSQVHFESGTLKAHQIDPFGANVAFDQKNQRFYPVSQQETIEDAQRAKALQAQKEQRQAALNQIVRLLELRGKLGDPIPKDKGTDKIDDLIAASLESLADAPKAQRLTATTSLVMADVAQVRAFQLIEDILAATEEVKGLLKDSNANQPPRGWPQDDMPVPLAIDPREKIEALHKSRVWYEQRLKTAQDHLLSLQEAVQEIEKKAREAFDNRNTEKERYELAKSQLKTIEELRIRADATAAEELKTTIQQFWTDREPLDPNNVSEALDRLRRRERDAETAHNTALVQAEKLEKIFTQGKLKEDLVERHVQSLAELAASVILLSASLESASQLTAPALTTAGKPTACPEGTQLQRGFQIMGPEGFRTFDQSERLIMAMSSSGKPLLSVMQELSARILNQKTTESDRLLPLANERIRLLHAQRLVDQAGVAGPKDVDAFIQQIIKAFEEQ
jgi:hypothetical protein